MASVRPLDGTRELSVEEVDAPDTFAAEWTTRLRQRPAVWRAYLGARRLLGR